MIGSSLAARDGGDNLLIESSVTLEECLCLEDLPMMTELVAARRPSADRPPTAKSEFDRWGTEESLLDLVALDMMLAGAGDLDWRGSAKLGVGADSSRLWSASV